MPAARWSLKYDRNTLQGCFPLLSQNLWWFAFRSLAHPNSSSWAWSAHQRVLGCCYPGLRVKLPICSYLDETMFDIFFTWKEFKKSFFSPNPWYESPEAPGSHWIQMFRYVSWVHCPILSLFSSPFRVETRRRSTTTGWRPGRFQGAESKERFQGAENAARFHCAAVLLSASKNHAKISGQYSFLILLCEMFCSPRFLPNFLYRFGPSSEVSQPCEANAWYWTRVWWQRQLWLHLDTGLCTWMWIKYQTHNVTYQTNLFRNIFRNLLKPFDVSVYKTNHFGIQRAQPQLPQLWSPVLGSWMAGVGHPSWVSTRRARWSLFERRRVVAPSWSTMGTDGDCTFEDIRVKNKKG